MFENSARLNWDKKVESLAYSIFMSSEVLDIIEPNWSIEQYETIENLPVFFKKKIGFTYSLQPFLTLKISGYEQLDTKLWNSFFPKICQFNLDKLRHDLPRNWDVREMKCQKLNLDIDLNEIFEGFTINIKRISKNSNNFSIHNDISLSHYFDFLNKNNKFFNKMKPELFEKFKYLISFFHSRGLGEILAIKEENEKVLATSFFVFDKFSVIDFKGAVSSEGKKKSAMVILHIEAIKRYHGQFKVYDFHGSNSSGRGQFNRKFGAKNEIYYQYTRINYPKPIKYLIRKLWSI